VVYGTDPRNKGEDEDLTGRYSSVLPAVYGDFGKAGQVEQATGNAEKRMIPSRSFWEVH
jgi:hypothetical protein